MKKIFLVLFQFCAVVGFGQQPQYEIKLTNLHFLIKDPVRNTSNNSNVTIDLIFSDNSSVQLYFRQIKEEEHDELNWSLNPPLISTKRPTAVRVRGYVNFRSGTDANFNKLYPVSECTDKSYYTSSGTGRMSEVTFLLKISPILDNALVQPSDNAFPIADSIPITSNFKGFPSSVYNWNFSTDNGDSWFPFPSAYQYLDSVRLTAEQLFIGSGLNVNDYIGRNVLVRLSACDGSVLSNAIVLNIKKSPPNIASSTVTTPRCFDSNDGAITFTFDRPLHDGESLLLNLKDSTHPGIFYSRQITAADLDASNTYVFPEKLQPAVYYLVYQGQFVFVATAGITQVSLSNIKSSENIGVEAPLPVSFSASGQNSWCHNGNDGKIFLTASGGNGQYQYMIRQINQADSAWYSFEFSDQHTITNLVPGTWVLQVRDGKECYAISAPGGSVVSRQISITEPDEPLINNLVRVINPTGYGLANGSIEIEISGGTPGTDGRYSFEWLNEHGQVINTGIASIPSASGHRMKISGLADGKYVLHSADRNADSSSFNQGCTAVDTFLVRQPLPLKVAISIKDSILCKDNANGSLLTSASGGIIFTNGSPYHYTWKKRNPANVYEVLTAQTDSLATGLTSGWYAVNITDANGISLAADSTFFLPEPTVLAVAISKKDATCSGKADGSATAIVTGGTLAYTYMWSNGEATDAIRNLEAGSYLVFVKDRNGCQAQQHTTVAQPNAMQLSLTKYAPVCHNNCDGKLTANVSGGTKPYTYKWNGATAAGSTADNLCSGIYQVTVTDAGGCSLIQKDTLMNPAQLPLSLGPDRFLCVDQQLAYDISIAGSTGIAYRWSSNNGFSSQLAAVILDRSGTYYAEVRDAKGCMSKDTLLLTSSGSSISNEFALPTQAFSGERIVVVNTSDPKAEQVSWTLPAQATAVEKSHQYASFILPDTGVYHIQLTTFRGNCYAEQTKKMIVSARTTLGSIGNTRTPFIKAFLAAPNPSQGAFTIKITLEEKAPVQLKLINILTNQTRIVAYQSGADNYTIPVNVSMLAGTYVLLLETPKGSETIKLVIL